ncbi:MAG: hypothetical protein RMJ82_12710 [Gemmatales bacterium]|nr:hypothetical protein [Gemmatales bacterium]
MYLNYRSDARNVVNFSQGMPVLSCLIIHDSWGADSLFVLIMPNELSSVKNIGAIASIRATQDAVLISIHKPTLQAYWRSYVGTPVAIIGCAQ